MSAFGDRAGSVIYQFHFNGLRRQILTIEQWRMCFESSFEAILLELSDPVFQLLALQIEFGTALNRVLARGALADNGTRHTARLSAGCSLDWC